MQSRYHDTKRVSLCRADMNKSCIFGVQLVRTDVGGAAPALVLYRKFPGRAMADMVGNCAYTFWDLVRTMIDEIRQTCVWESMPINNTNSTGAFCGPRFTSGRSVTIGLKPIGFPLVISLVPRGQARE